MPELPEVETVCQGLSDSVTGLTFDEIELRRDAIRFPIPANLPEVLTGQRIKQVRRRAKYILMDTQEGNSLLIHLGMSGKVLLMTEADYQPKKHDHVLFRFVGGSMMVFHDPRRFGVVDMSETKTLDQHPLLTKLGIEPLEDSFTPTWLYEQVSSRKSDIKTLLMNANIIVGVGNIYASEALFRARIKPTRKASTLTPRECEQLVISIKQVLLDAIASGGSTLRDYVRSSGDVGYFQHRFAVYARTDQPCIFCKNPIQQIKQSGRSTFMCKVCQL